LAAGRINPYARPPAGRMSESGQKRINYWTGVRAQFAVRNAGQLHEPDQCRGDLPWGIFAAMPNRARELERIPVMFEHSRRGAGNSCILWD
jgi:hypothetical protein